MKLCVGSNKFYKFTMTFRRDDSLKFTINIDDGAPEQHSKQNYYLINVIN